MRRPPMSKKPSRPFVKTAGNFEVKAMKKFILLALGLVPLPALSWTTDTSDDVWRSGWGQGTAESEVTNGSGNKIYVACEDGSGIDSSISFSINGDGPKDRTILLSFDNGAPESIPLDQNGNLTSALTTESSAFQHVIEKLKKHHAVYVSFPDGRASEFTLTGAAKAIGNCKSHGKKEKPPLMSASIAGGVAALGFSPNKACQFLAPIGMVSNAGYTALSGPDDYSCGTRYKEVGAGTPLSNNISYYVRGTPEVAKRLRILANVNQPSSSDGIVRALVKAAQQLFHAAFNSPLPPHMEKAILNERPGSWTHQGYIVELERQSWPTDKGYELNFVIREASYVKGK